MNSQIKEVQKTSVMFCSLGADAQDAVTSTLHESVFEIWGSLVYEESERNGICEGMRYFSVQGLIKNAIEQEKIPASPRTDDLDIVNDSPAILYILDYMQGRLYNGLCSSLNERRAITNYLISYWSSALKESKPDLIISQAVPHEVVDFALFVVAQRNKVPWVSLQYNPWGHRLVTLNIKSDGNLVCTPIRLSEALYTDRKLQAERVERLLVRHREMQEWSTRLDVKYAEAGKRSLEVWEVLRLLLKASIKGLLIKENCNEIAYLKWILRSSKFNTTNKTEVDLSGDFIYFPLNYQPEMTTCPLGGIFCDQLTAIRALATALPEGWTIYVKEHPCQYSRYSYGYLGRTELFYKEIEGIRNVSMIPSGVHSKILIDKAQLVATITGSVGYEALARSKCVIIFGEVWYKNIEGSFVVKKPSDVKEALAQALSHRIDGERINAQMKSIAEETFKFFGEELLALAFEYPWNPEKEKKTFEAILQELPVVMSAIRNLGH